MSLYPSIEVKEASVKDDLWYYTKGRSSGHMPVGEYLRMDRQPLLHALVIGIDKYQSNRIPNLRGAVADADALVKYLREELHVPDGQIYNLRDEKATRDAIIGELRDLRWRNAIRKGDPILIFFAGHGTTTNAPPGWVTASQKISLIVPHDCWDMKSADIRTHAIPDRTIGALLHELAEPESGPGKGNNITVILDCCSSGSGTRIPEFSDSHRERCFEPDEPVLIPPALDEDIWGNVPQDRSTTVLSGYFFSGMRSHVLLAACRESEHAREGSLQGMFTTVLLEALRGVAMDKLTYRDLMQRIRTIPYQTPQCEGHNTDRILFDAKVVSKGRLVYQATFRVSDSKFILEAGAIHSITSGARFTVYASKELAIRNQPFAFMKASEVRPFETVLKCVAYTSLTALNVEMAKPAPSWLAVQTSMGRVEALRLYVRPSRSVRPVTEAFNAAIELQRRSGGPGIILCQDDVSSHLSISSHEGHIDYTICDSVLRNLGLRARHQTTNTEPNHICAVLNAAARFFWHLDSSPQKNEVGNSIEVEMYKIVRNKDVEAGRTLLRPWTTSGPNLLSRCSDYVELLADRTTAYGIGIRSSLQVPLHIWVFYFDCSKLSITEYYKPPATGNGAEASLPANGVLSVGYGAGGGAPFTYYVNPPQDMDVGYLKIFASTKQVDLSHIEQHSPFSTPTTIRGMERKADEPDAMWDTHMITVVQRSPGPARRRTGQLRGNVF
ncbi:hypothetical protein PENSPDRAFT_756783 [Peniophora sp. CONT]|nr:hypothetical protein PENSPDRAFT_756783 [Peniophora sp. CONT]